MSEYTASTKLECIEREIKMRRRVYPGLVMRGKMRQAVADYEIKIMEEIAADYRALVPKLL